jgi:hypothetical protein
VVVGSLESALTLIKGNSYTITVGGGGTASNPGTNGSNSVFSTITSIGGGRGGNYGNPTGTNGVDGGSGGGGGGGESGSNTGGSPTNLYEGFKGGNVWFAKTLVLVVVAQGQQDKCHSKCLLAQAAAQVLLRVLLDPQ